MVRDMSANISFGWLVVIGNLSWLQQSSTRSFEWRPKGISHSLYVPWSLWYFWLGPNPNCSWTQTDLVLDPNPIWSRTQIRFGLGTKSDLVLEPSRIWSWSQLGFGLGPNSDLVLDPNSDLVSDPGLSERGYSEAGYSEVTWNPVTPNRCSTLVISWHLDFLHNDSSGKLMNSSRARFSKKLFGAAQWGILGVENDPFWYCSSLSLTILLKISQKIALLKTFRTM